MKTPNQQRDEALIMLCDVLESLAQSKPSTTAKIFIDRARAGLRHGDVEYVTRNIHIAKSYVLPEKVIV